MRRHHAGVQRNGPGRTDVGHDVSRIIVIQRAVARRLHPGGHVRALPGQHQALVGNAGEIGMGIKQRLDAVQLADGRGVERLHPVRHAGSPAFQHPRQSRVRGHLPEGVVAVGVAAPARKHALIQAPALDERIFLPAGFVAMLAHHRGLDGSDVPVSQHQRGGIKLGILGTAARLGLAHVEIQPR